jgi:hypothetical protein
LLPMHSLESWQHGCPSDARKAQPIDPAQKFASCDPTLATRERNAGSSTSLRFAQNDSREGGAPNFVFILSGRINSKRSKVVEGLRDQQN